MGDSSSNSNHMYQDNFTSNTNAQNINVDVDNMPHTNDNDATTNNLLNRNNITARDHLFQAMFSRIALTYDRTFPPFARRFIEFMLLLTAISVLFILIYIHMAFVKAPITCLDHFAFNENIVRDASDGSIKHMVIRVEVLSNPPSKYSLYHSYSKEYDDLNRINQSDSLEHSKLSSSEKFSQLSMFFNVIRKQCSKNFARTEYRGEKTDDDKSYLDVSKEDEKQTDKSSEGLLHKLFNFPINPILEKAEYWREKLSVRAMAPFRQTFNELELFAKSVFTEEKYIMEYSLEYGLLRLTPQTRERLNIPVHFVLLDANKDQCFGNGISRFLLQEFVGYDQIIIGSLKRLAERQNGKGYVRNVVSGEHYRFVNSWMSRTSYLAAGFIMIIFTLSVSMLLRYSHHQIFVFIVDLLRMLENNLQFSFPAAPLLTVVLALVGMEAIMSEFFNDTSTAFYTILIIWLADQYEAVCCRTYVSKRHWPKYFYLYHFAFYAYHYRFNGQFSGLALLCSWLFIQHSMFFFFHHYELPRLMHGIAVRAIMDSLVVERAENTSRTSSSMFPNDDDNDQSDGDRYDHDEDPGSSSNLPSMAASGEIVQDKDDHANCHVEGDQEENHQLSNNLQFNSCNLRASNSSQYLKRKRFTMKKIKYPPKMDIKSNTLFCTGKTIDVLKFMPEKCLLNWRNIYVENCLKITLSYLTILRMTLCIINQAFTVINSYIKLIKFKIVVDSCVISSKFKDPIPITSKFLLIITTDNRYLKTVKTKLDKDVVKNFEYNIPLQENLVRQQTSLLKLLPEKSRSKEFSCYLSLDKLAALLHSPATRAILSRQLRLSLKKIAETPVNHFNRNSFRQIVRRIIIQFIKSAGNFENKLYSKSCFDSSKRFLCLKSVKFSKDYTIPTINNFSYRLNSFKPNASGFSFPITDIKWVKLIFSCVNIFYLAQGLFNVIMYTLTMSLPSQLLSHTETLKCEDYLDSTYECQCFKSYSSSLQLKITTPENIHDNNCLVYMVCSTILQMWLTKNETSHDCKYENLIESTNLYYIDNVESINQNFNMISLEIECQVTILLSYSKEHESNKFLYYVSSETSDQILFPTLCRNFNYFSDSIIPTPENLISSKSSSNKLLTSFIDKDSFLPFFDLFPETKQDTEINLVLDNLVLV